ncbi:hypothetical protein [Flaviaesturariibacter aridisoli]|uniref:SdiA-regulated family protein n=1 Tax=Flaviaesturariibacter aridisoli TaxID=2545761 RepID=A0A4R4DX03_9BACT|nr:hypothetical protein [Flaviaesturariibacter aridisoli]TCZ68865.1 hypothetical protein E0486_13380 [Flaviaesturariibacter aridisoli]
MIFLLSSCQLFTNPHSPAGYVLPRPEIHFLGKKLSEVSGLFYLKGTSSMLAIADDKKHVFRVYTDGTVDDFYTEEFAPSADYEDVLQLDSTVYVLASDGTLFASHRADSGLVTETYHLEVPLPETVERDAEGKPKEGSVDFETMYYDSSARGVILLSKNIKGENNTGVRTAWRFDPATRRFDPKPFYTIRQKDVADVLKDGKAQFKPSAAAFNPLSGQLFILSSAGHLLVITNGRDSVEAAYRLNPSFYPQAEGIAFAENGDMYISNEAKLGKATLLRIPYGRKGKRH